MKIVIAGGTGFLGQPLAARLADTGHDVVVLTRRHQQVASRSTVRFVSWTAGIPITPGVAGSGNGAWAAEIDGAGAVVNLAGESIAGARWSPAHKARVRDSRVLATRSLVEAIGRASSPPAFISGSAVGYYGSRGDEVLTEDAAPGSDFLARVCVDWESEAARAAASGSRVVFLRTGLVLEAHGGALRQMLLPFKLGVGGRLGSGRQYWPWIHRADWVDLVCWAILTPAVTGPVNATSPAPVTNAEFTRALGRSLHRPTMFPAPAFALRVILGEMADALLLSGQRAVPEKAQRLEFAFRYTNITNAFDAIFA